MDVTPSWLPGQRAPEEPDLAAMEALAGRPVSERWPWLADLEAWARHPRPEIRAAVLRCLFGCDGKEAEALVVAGLHDGHEIVWRAALEALAQTPAGSFQLLVHAATHPEVAVRRAAIPAVLARWQVLGARMLADPDARDEVVAAMGRSVMLPTTIDPALQHVALGHLPTPAFARWTLSLTWSHPWNVITNVHPVRHVAAPSGQPTPPVAAIQIAVENAAKQADGLDALFAAWREDQGVSATIAQAVLATSAVDHVNETRLCMAALLAATRDPDLPASWVALAARRWPAVLGWDALPASTRRRAAAWLRPDPVRLPKPVPVDMLDPGNLLGPPLDVELVLTLLRIGPPDTLVAMSTWLDAPTFVALARARPEAASAILTSPGASAESCSAQRITWMKAVIAESANAVELVGALVLSGGDRAAEAVAALPRDAVPTWLGDLDRLARRARPERVQHAIDLLAKRKPPPRFADLKALLAMEDPGPVTQGLTGRLIGEQKPETLARLTHAELTRLAAWDAIAPLAPWEHLQALGALLPPELARRFGWVPPEPGHPLERDLPAPGPPREIRRKEANALASASVRELAERVAPFTTTSVTGLIAALGTRRHRSELACVACLASRDPLAEVASGLDRNGLPSVLHAVDLRMVVLWSGREDLSPAAALWLYRFDPPLERFLAWAEERAGGLAWVLEESQGWASAELRERAWRAAVRHAQRARWRRRPIPADLDRIALRARTSLPALAAELRVALGTEQLPTPPRPPTSAPTIPS
ncbi:MAG: HEAT repeat domain-containing protein, partial [Alphaproteobacteria bacterium]|nr:HEAT repeat domain-containing protein [Alphaproteobacteria bacterium]